MVLICIYMMNSNKHFFIYLFVFLGKMSIRVFCLFSNQVTWFLLLSCMKWSEVAQSCPTLCDPMDCSLPGSSVHGILQARILKWVAISFSRGSSRPRDGTQVSHIAGRCFNLWATREAWWVVWVPYISWILTSYWIDICKYFSPIP